MKSNLEIIKFIENNNISRDEFGNCIFLAKINYQSPMISINTKTEVKIIRNGYDDGKIKLSENEMLTVENYHLDFSTDYQVYTYNSDLEQLEIHGKSPKMGGVYSVTIILE